MPRDTFRPWDAIEAMNERRAAALGLSDLTEVEGQVTSEDETANFIRGQLAGLDVDYDDLIFLSNNVAATALEDDFAGGADALPDDRKERAAATGTSLETIHRAISLKTVAADCFLAGVYYERKRAGVL